ncbi:MAG TPA: YfhO family protein [Gemmataceae bacterium]|nr:YfhO family protein [Gemmataceae bacterium]
MFLALIAFWPLVLHPTETLYSDSSDLLAEHLPAKIFLVRSLRETGELPLWNPEQYAGSPFVHDIQVGLFYPPNLPLYFISEPAIGTFLSWLVFVHVLLAGWLMYAYARHTGMGELAAFTAGVGFMLSPRWMMQLFLAGHTVTQGICWTPLVILCVERSIQRRSWRWALGGGVAYALFVLGTHPQWAFYGSLLIGLWPLRLASRERQRPVVSETPASLKEDYADLSPSPPASGREGRSEGGQTSHPEVPISFSGEPQPPSPPTPLPPTRGERGAEPRTRDVLTRWLLAEAIVVLIGQGLCAVQLLPTIEAAGESSRAHGMGQSWSLDGAKAALMGMIGPIPDKWAEPIHWETRDGIGFTWAVLAIVGASLGGRRALVPIVITLGMLAYALGGSYVVDPLPGFNNFRMPTRVLLTMSFPLAFLAGQGIQSLDRRWETREFRVASIVAITLASSPPVVAYLNNEFPKADSIALTWVIYWSIIPVLWLGVVLAGVRERRPSRVLIAVALMVADVLLSSVPYASTCPQRAVYQRSPVLDYVREHNTDGLRVYDFGPLFQNVLGPGSPQSSAHGIPSIVGYNPLDVARYRRFLAFVADVGEPQRAFLGEFTHPVVMTFRLANRDLFDLLGVAYLIIELDVDGPFRNSALSLRLKTSGPSSYCFLGAGLGSDVIQSLFENQRVLPRAFVVAHAIQQAPDAEVLPQLKSIDVRRAATLEDWAPGGEPLPDAPDSPGPARIRSHSPNRIAVDLDGQTAGLLVLTDPWYPGWVCRIDGQETKIWKADYAFRGVMVPAGSREVVFHFEPQSYRRGKWISLATIAVVAVFFVITSIRERARKSG